jgi:prophage regulatory protein
MNYNKRPDTGLSVRLGNFDELPDSALVRLPTFLQLLPVSKSTLYHGIRTGRFPAPVRSGRITMWSVKSIRILVQQLEQEGVQS